MTTNLSLGLRSLHRNVRSMLVSSSHLCSQIRPLQHALVLTLVASWESSEATGEQGWLSPKAERPLMLKDALWLGVGVFLPLRVAQQRRLRSGRIGDVFPDLMSLWTKCIGLLSWAVDGEVMWDTGSVSFLQV